jgi:hypothetical protein
LDRLFGWDADRSIIGPRPQVVKPALQVIGPKPTATVEAPPRFAWDEKRWHRTITDDIVEVMGRYRVHDRQRRQWREFDGYVTQRGREIAAYIADPPAEMKQHRHGPCLQMIKAPWFRLHWRREPKDLDAAVLYLEQMLDESINR